ATTGGWPGQLGEVVGRLEGNMGEVVEFLAARQRPQSEIVTRIEAFQTMQVKNVEVFMASVQELGEGLRDIDRIAHCIQDAEVREELRRLAQSVRREFLLALEKLSNALAPVGS
ncbi:MAG: hypothetical protein ACLP8B_02375, partial [Xanthobacteraceae bacterium]